MAAQTTAIDSRNWLLTRRWLLVASAMLFLWIIAQIDKTNVSLIIADRAFLKELNLIGHNAELGGLMSTFFIIERGMRPVIRHLLDHGVAIPYDSLPVSKLRARLSRP